TGAQKAPATQTPTQATDPHAPTGAAAAARATGPQPPAEQAAEAPRPDAQEAAPTADPRGIAGSGVRAWIAARQGVEPDSIGFQVLSVGRSNLTYTITLDGAPRWVLRRPPLGHTGGSAHD